MRGQISGAWVQGMACAAAAAALAATAPITRMADAGPPPSAGREGEIRSVAAAASGWTTVPAFADYAPAGMPDFDQRRARWRSNPEDGSRERSYTHDGPLTAAAALWWLDSKLEPGSSPPPTRSDGSGIVTAYGDWDDHSPENLEPLVGALALAADTNGSAGDTLPYYGTCVDTLIDALDDHLSAAGGTRYQAVPLWRPTTHQLKVAIEAGQPIIVLVGLWQQYLPGAGDWARIGGHYVTIQAVDTRLDRILIADPFRNVTVGGGYPDLHDDAAIVSHDPYLVSPSLRPAGGPVLRIDGYLDGAGVRESILDNFQNHNRGPCDRSDAPWLPEVRQEAQLDVAIVLQPAPTPTPTHTASPTPTSTSTPTVTRTATPSPTPSSPPPPSPSPTPTGGSAPPPGSSPTPVIGSTSPPPGPTGAAPEPPWTPTPGTPVAGATPDATSTGSATEGTPLPTAADPGGATATAAAASPAPIISPTSPPAGSTATSAAATATAAAEATAGGGTASSPAPSATDRTDGTPSATPLASPSSTPDPADPGAHPSPSASATAPQDGTAVPGIPSPDPDPSPTEPPDPGSPPPSTPASTATAIPTSEIVTDVSAICGRIVDQATGDGVPNAAVWLQRRDAGHWRDAAAAVASDDGGRFCFQEQPADRYRVVAERPECDIATTTVLHDPPSEPGRAIVPLACRRAHGQAYLPIVITRTPRR